MCVCRGHVDRLGPKPVCVCRGHVDRMGPKPVCVCGTCGSPGSKTCLCL